MVLTFILLGWVFFEFSGGADFVPETRPVAASDPVQSDPETVTRADTAELSAIPAAVSQPATTAKLAATAVAAVAVPAAVPAPAPAPMAVPEPATVQPAPAFVSLSQPQPVVPGAADLRFVEPELVNMRDGPGTDYAVADKLSRGTTAEVLESDGNGWVRVHIIATDQIGWIAERLLTKDDI
jgi:uncharacterized protein YgiM (DUF1202 family)